MISEARLVRPGIIDSRPSFAKTSVDGVVSHPEEKAEHKKFPFLLSLTVFSCLSSFLFRESDAL